MRKPLITLYIALLLASGCKTADNDDAAITAVVTKWNEIHNTKYIPGYVDLYALNIQFYGTQQDLAVLLPKLKLYTAKDSAQEIITPLDIRYYKSGTVKCSFTKRIYRNRKVKEYPTYLLLQKRFNKYLITGESDLITDSNKKITLNLGDEIGKTVSKNVLIVISFISLFLGALAFYLIKKRRDKIIEDSKPLDGSVYLKKEEIIVEKNSVEEMKTVYSLENQTDWEKGYDFEKYVSERFEKPYFKIKEWRSDKYHKGVYAISNKYPDFEIEYSSKYHKLLFSVECKWRSGFENNYIKLGKEGKLKEYKEFSKEFRQEVFIVLGVGGIPRNPESVYIIPIFDLASTTYTQQQIRKYLRYKKGNFFLNVDQMILE